MWIDFSDNVISNNRCNYNNHHYKKEIFIINEQYKKLKGSMKNKRLEVVYEEKGIFRFIKNYSVLFCNC